jgi:hypothetical protein
MGYPALVESTSFSNKPLLDFPHTEQTNTHHALHQGVFKEKP